jgi:V8-like Glu-specific endopeptidase
LQHPSGEPMKLSIDDDGVMSANAGQTRLRYRNNTEGGSSGSPCFTFKWELAALHHSGDPNFDPAHKPTYNQGIPLTAIMNLLNERNVLAKLPDPED